MTNPIFACSKAGRRLFAGERLSLSPGRNFTLEETIKLAANENAVAIWGPYESIKGLIWSSARRLSTQESSYGPMTASIERIEWPSIAFTWPV
jgi:hypothetical protein